MLVGHVGNKNYIAMEKRQNNYFYTILKQKKNPGWITL